jgi:hypothetical protein
LGGTERRYE